MKVSLITTVFNEEKMIRFFLNSAMKQIKMPDEIIIVDGGSTDNTLSVISNFKFQISNKKIKILRKRGNRSVGRNEAIKHTTGDIIVCSDVGCILDKDWVKNITAAFQDEGVDVVAGFYKPITKNVFEKCLATYTCVMPDRVNPATFLPSSRSIAFRKRVWKKVGGYPEYLDTCEDLVFAKELKTAGCRFTFRKDALVYWPQRETMAAAFRQFFTYAKGDGAARHIRVQTPLLFARFCFSIVLVVLFFTYRTIFLFSTTVILLCVYIVWSIWKNYRYVRRWEAYVLLPTIQVVADLAVPTGFLVGFFSRRR